MHCILVIGSAHLDILGRTTGDDSTIDKIGQVSIEIGGTGCNIAANLAKMGVVPRLLTALNTSIYAKIIADHLRKSGVDLRVHSDPALPDSAFSAHIDSDGEMTSAVSAISVEHVTFFDQEILAALANARACVVEANLSRATLAQVAHLCEQERVPLYAAAVSEEKSLRLLALAHSGALSGVFMNRTEAGYLIRFIRTHKQASPAQPIEGRAISRAELAYLAGIFDLGVTTNDDDTREIAELLGAPVFLTMGKEGAALVTSGCAKPVQGRKVAVEGEANTLGAGDMLMAKTLFEITHGTPREVALAMGVEEATRLCLHVNCNTSDADALRRTIGHLDAKAHRDVLTGLYNRQAGEELLRTAAHEQGIFLLLLDIDHFKSVNDTFGHAAGDEVLRAVASVVQTSLREQDVAIRWGGEEFVCLVRAEILMGAENTANRLRTRVSSLAQRPDGTPVTVSIGVCRLMADSNESFAAADDALYEAKRGGRNRVISRNLDASPEECA